MQIHISPRQVLHPGTSTGAGPVIFSDAFADANGSESKGEETLYMGIWVPESVISLWERHWASFSRISLLSMTSTWAPPTFFPHVFCSFIVLSNWIATKYFSHNSIKSWKPPAHQEQIPGTVIHPGLFCYSLSKFL